MHGEPELDGEYASGMELMKRLAENPQVRTLVLGHTHYNALEVLQSGDELLPGKLPIDSASAAHFATLEVQNPVRGFAMLDDGVRAGDEYDLRALALAPIEDRYAWFESRYEQAVPGWSRTLGGPAPAASARELVVLRIVSNADLANETYSDGKNALGFSVLHLTKTADARGVECSSRISKRSRSIGARVSSLTTRTTRSSSSSIGDVARSSRAVTGSRGASPTRRARRRGR